MATTSETAEILKNVQLGDCLPASEGPFFADLSLKGSPSNAQEAAQNSKAVVAANEDAFLCQGNDIPATQFDQLARLSTLKGFVRTLSKNEASRVLGDLGLTFGALEAASSDDVERFLAVYNEPACPYQAPIHVRGQNDLAFVTDRSFFPSPLPIWRDLVDQLGLRHYSAVPFGLVVHYSRRGLALTPLRVPRAFDGIDYPPFRVEIDCTATQGTTAPLSVGPARPEGVHRGCQISRDHFTVDLCQ